jgi:hypothetical protein
MSDGSMVWGCLHHRVAVKVYLCVFYSHNGNSGLEPDDPLECLNSQRGLNKEKLRIQLSFEDIDDYVEEYQLKVEGS